jgi:acyl-CoA synthetase (AMP-forming)/AMP-acid ligase II
MTQSDSRTEFATLIELLRFRAARQPSQRAYTFLLDGETEEAWLTYEDLDRKARSVAAWLRTSMANGERVLLLFPPGLDFITAFFGCIYAGTVAVPVYPPEPSRLKRNVPLLRAVVNDAQPIAALTTSRILGLVEDLIVEAPVLRALRWLALEDGRISAADQWSNPCLDGQNLALIQYTSGSTSAPKGVMISHGNLLHNGELIHKCVNLSPDSRGMIWLPPYHDLGLVGGILQPLYGGFPVTLMSPVAFSVRPLRWLQAISRTRATISGGPNFAYDLCARKITSEQRLGLDLSSWKVAFNGSEPVRFDTMDRFTKAFSSCGFLPEAFYPCYGLAEATSYVSGGAKSDSVKLRPFNGTRSEPNRRVDGDGQKHLTHEVVGCGWIARDQKVIVVDPGRRIKMPAGQVGEVWVSSPSVALGYWNRPEETDATFQAYLADTREGPFLRTGDLGFLQDNELFITGRLKDLIIIGGRNHYPQDIEWTVEQSHPGLRPGCSAAFSIDCDAQERLIVAAEIDPRFFTRSRGDRGEIPPRSGFSLDPTELVWAIRQAVTEHHDVRADGVLLLKPASLPKTTSGKIQRYACRDRFIRGDFELLNEVES